jgi:hypothetical protein
MELERKMEYAIRLADLQFHHEFEDLFKLASLVEEIAELQQTSAKANEELLNEFHNAISSFFKARGAFRQEVERFAKAKKLIQNI